MDPRAVSGIRRVGAFVALAALVAVPDALQGQTEFRRGQIPSPPPFHAIQNARLVTVSGGVIENGTIVLENSVITAVGTDVDVPPEARVIDGTGLTVYPGLIDAMTTLGHTSSSAAARNGGTSGPRRGGNGEDRSWGPEDRPATTPWVSAADDLDPEDERIERWRHAGFTTAATTPEHGFFPGQAAVINLAGFRGREMVIHTPVGLRVNLSGGPGHSGYPTSLMGGFAYLRQTFMDADHYGRIWTAYEASPTGRVRPEYDETLEPIRTAVAGSWPIFFPAASATEIGRALTFGDELGLNMVVYGAHGAYEAADDLVAAGAAVLVSLDWPRPSRDADPDREPTLAELRLRERAPTTPATLEEAGVDFAFFTDGMRDPTDALTNARYAVKAGLSPEGAIRAFTLSAAEILGIDDRTGSLDVGKMANLVVTEGDLLDDSSTVKMVLVDGHVFESRDRLAEREEEFRRMAGEAGSSGGTRSSGGRGSWGGFGGGKVAMPSEFTGLTPTTPRGPYQTADAWIVRNATIMTGTGETIDNGSIAIVDGKITAVGADVDAPADATEIDAGGQWVIPGIIDAHSHIAGDGGINEGTITVSAMVGIEDILDPDDVGIYRAVAGGVTTANILHGSANPIGGKNAVLKMRWGADANGLLVDGAAPGIKFALGENPSRTRNPQRYPNTRLGVMDVIRQAFTDAAAYKAEWDAYEAGDNGDVEPRRDLALDALVEILDGDRLVHAHSYRADEILQLLRLAEEFDFQIATFQHVLEGYRVAEEIAEHGAGASTFSDWWAYKVEAYEAIPHNAAIMAEQGVVVSINSDSGEEMRHLNQEAAKTMKWGGLDEHEALALVTINPARQLGIDDRVGSLEVGKDADLVIYDGHPLSMFSRVEKTMIDGAIYFDREMDGERQAQLEHEKQTLIEKFGRGQEGRGRPVTDRVITEVPGGAR
jgi:imidazolonepropionase-like amidohydrolase